METKVKYQQNTIINLIFTTEISQNENEGDTDLQKQI